MFKRTTCKIAASVAAGVLLTSAAFAGSSDEVFFGIGGFAGISDPDGSNVFSNVGGVDQPGFVGVDPKSGLRLTMSTNSSTAGDGILTGMAHIHVFDGETLVASGEVPIKGRARSADTSTSFVDFDGKDFTQDSVFRSQSSFGIAGRARVEPSSRSTSGSTSFAFSVKTREKFEDTFSGSRGKSPDEGFFGTLGLSASGPDVKARARTDCRIGGFPGSFFSFTALLEDFTAASNLSRFTGPADLFTSIDGETTSGGSTVVAARYADAEKNKIGKYSITQSNGKYRGRSAGFLLTTFEEASAEGFNINQLDTESVTFSSSTPSARSTFRAKYSKEALGEFIDDIE